MITFETRDWYTNSEAGMGIEYPFVDHRNVVGVIFLGSEGYMIFPDYSSYYTFLGREARTRAQRLGRRQSDDGSRPVPELGRRRSQPQISRT